MDKEDKIEFIIKGVSLGEEISTSHIPISLLNYFVKDINTILSSLDERDKSEDIVLSIEKGSVRLIPHLKASEHNLLRSEFESAWKYQDLSIINPKRAKVLDSWFKYTEKNPNIEFSVKPTPSKEYTINPSQRFQKKNQTLWADVELYLYGDILNLGGSSKTNIHIKTDEGISIVVNCKREDLASEKENRLYKTVGIRVQAKQDLISGARKDFQFIEFIDYNPIYNPDKLNSAIEKGRKAWSDIDDHVKWISELRDNEE